jgi:hypothetical protein
VCILLLALQLMQDPSMLKTAAEMMKSMPPEQLKAAMAQAGQHMPAGIDIDPEQFSQMAEAVAKMPPEQLELMSKAAASHAAAGGSSISAGAGAQSSSIDVTPGASGGVLAGDGMPDISAMMTPEMMKMAADMMRDMRPEDMAAMSQMAAGGGANASPASERLAGTVSAPDVSHGEADFLL